MTSGEFHSIEISSIIVNRDQRQRQQLNEAQLEELAESIEALGLIHPIVVTRELVLVSGERRLEACRRLGWTHISAQYTDELDPKRLQLLEYEENIKRVDLTADEQCHALVSFHELNVQLDPTWNQNKTADALHKSKSALSNDLRVAYAHVSGDRQICAASTMSAKRNILARRDERNARLALAELDPTHDETILTEDFNSWAPTYQGPRFNFLHVDFPWGVGADKFGQSSAPVHGDYDDRPEVFDRLAVVGKLLDRKEAGPTMSGTHLYTVVLAPTGSGTQRRFCAQTHGSMLRRGDPGGDAAAPPIRPALGHDHGVINLRALQLALRQQYLAPPEPWRQASLGSREVDQSRTHRPVRRGSQGNSLHHRMLRPLGVGSDLHPAQARPRAAARLSESVRSESVV